MRGVLNRFGDFDESFRKTAPLRSRLGLGAASLQ